MSFEPGVGDVHQPRGGRKAKNRLHGLKIDFVSLVKAGDNPTARVVLLKRRPDGTQDDGDVVDKQDNGDSMPTKEEALQGAPAAVVAYVEQLEAAVIKAEEERDEALAQADAAADSGDESSGDQDDVEKVLKSVQDPAIRRVLEKTMAEAAEAKAEAAIAKAAAETEAAARARMILKHRVSESMPNLGDIDQTTDLLQAVAKGVPQDTYLALEQLLKAANNHAAMGAVFKEFGQPGGNTTAASPLDAKVEELRKADPQLTEAAAYDRAMSLYPGLYYQSVGGAH